MLAHAVWAQVGLGKSLAGHLARIGSLQRSDLLPRGEGQWSIGSTSRFRSGHPASSLNRTIKHLHVEGMLFQTLPPMSEFMGTVTDITCRKQAGQALRRSEKEPGEVIDTIRALVWIGLKCIRKGSCQWSDLVEGAHLSSVR